MPSAREIVARVQALPSATTPAVRTVRRALTRELASRPGRDVVRLALSLVATDDAMARFIAYELVLHHAGALALIDDLTARELGASLDSWSAVDCFACYVAGPAWRARQISDDAVRAWTISNDRWWRRAAVVSTVALNNRARGGTGDTLRTVDICRRVVTDRDDMVVKALSWALRELSKRDAPAVRAFLADHAEALAPRVLREVGNKLTTGRKSGASVTKITRRQAPRSR